jgi:hypothetical protein
MQGGRTGEKRERGWEARQTATQIGREGRKTRQEKERKDKQKIESTARKKTVNRQRSLTCMCWRARDVEGICSLRFVHVRVEEGGGDRQGNRGRIKDGWMPYSRNKKGK